MPRHFVVLGLGSNLGNRLEHLCKAAIGATFSRTAFISEGRCSEVFESEALLLPDSPSDWNIPFLNIAISGFTGLSPRVLLDRIKMLEQTLGRAERGRWAPREIDIDILVYDDDRIDEAELKIPHPGLLARPFALWPLAALAPNFRINEPGGSPITTLQASTKWGFQRREVPCRTWRARHETQQDFQKLLAAWALPHKPGPLPATELVGIVNVTPDSFSDGGKFYEARSAIEHAQELFDAGATVLDIGAESTRPGSGELASDEEWARLQPVLSGLKVAFADNPLRPALSVDTRHPEVAKLALDLGVDWINDVSGFSDPRMIEAVAESSCAVVAMHSLGIPPSKDSVLAKDSSAVSQILEWGAGKITALSKAGIEKERIILDPGIGFGKTPQQSLELALSAEKLLSLGVRILIGHSRKSFLSIFTNAEPASRDGETALLTALLARNGVHYLRVHNVSRNAAALSSILPRW